MSILYLHIPEYMQAGDSYFESQPISSLTRLCFDRCKMGEDDYVVYVQLVEFFHSTWHFFFIGIRFY